MDENNFQNNYNPSMNDNMSFSQQPQGFEQPVVEQPINNGFQPQPQQPKKKKTGIKILIIVLVLLLAIGGGAAVYYFMVVKNPKTTINSFFDSIDSKLGEALDLVEGNSELNSFEFSAHVWEDDNISASNKQYAEILNNSSLKIAVGFDKIKKEASINLSIDYNDDPITLSIYFDSQTKGIYVYSKEILGKTIKIAEATDETIESFINSLSDTTDTKNFIKAAQIVLKTLKNNITDDMIHSQEWHGNIYSDSNIHDATCVSITLDKNSVESLTYNVCKELKNNSEFINLFKDNIQNTVKTSLDNTIKDYETKDKNTTSNYMSLDLKEISFSIITTGFIPKPIKYELYQKYSMSYNASSYSSYPRYNLENEEDDEENLELVNSITLRIMEDNEYVLSMGSTQSDTSLKLNIKFDKEKNNKNKGKVNVSIPIENFGDISIYMAYQRELNREVPAPQTTGAVALNQLTSTDYQKLLTDLSAHEVTKPLASTAYYLIMYSYYYQQQQSNSSNPYASLYGTTNTNTTTTTNPYSSLYSSNTSTTSTVPAGKQKIGDENNGYLIVPDTWAEAAISTKVQYANYQDGTVTAVLSMDNVSTLENSAEDWATTIYNTEKNDSKTKTVDASTTKIGNYTAYKVEKERNDGYKQIGWFFETEDGKTHCIIIGGNTLTEDTLSIVDTYTLK